MEHDLDCFTVASNYLGMCSTQGDHSSWKVIENETEAAGSQEQLMKLCWTDCFVTLKYL